MADSAASSGSLTRRGSDENLVDIPGVTALVRIDEGGVCPVFRGQELSTGRGVAVKILPAAFDKSGRAAFDLEQRRLAGLADDAAIVRVETVGALPDGRPFLTSELCAESLAARVARGGPLDPRGVAALGAVLAGALARAHAAGVVHGAVTPHNVLIRRSGRVALADIGVASRLVYQGDLDYSGEFAAPETLRAGALHPGSDLYGLGVTLYTALTGGPPFPSRVGEHASERVLRVLSEPAPAVNVALAGATLASVIDDLLDSDSSTRPSSADDVARRCLAATGRESDEDLAEFLGAEWARRSGDRLPEDLVEQFGDIAALPWDDGDGQPSTNWSALLDDVLFDGSVLDLPGSVPAPTWHEPRPEVPPPAGDLDDDVRYEEPTASLPDDEPRYGYELPAAGTASDDVEQNALVNDLVDDEVDPYDEADPVSLEKSDVDDAPAEVMTANDADADTALELDDDDDDDDDEWERVDLAGVETPAVEPESATPSVGTAAMVVNGGVEDEADEDDEVYDHEADSAFDAADDVQQDETVEDADDEVEQDETDEDEDEDSDAVPVPTAETTAIDALDSAETTDQSDDHARPAHGDYEIVTRAPSDSSGVYPQLYAVPDDLGADPVWGTSSQWNAATLETSSFFGDRTQTDGHLDDDEDKPSSHSRRWALLAGVGVVSILAGTLIAGHNADDNTPTAAAPPRASSTTAAAPTTPSSAPAIRSQAPGTGLQLVSVVATGSSVRLRWTGKTGMDYAVLAAQPGQSASVTLVDHGTSAKVLVAPGRPYCFRIQGTDGETLLQSRAKGIKGATCT